jgi:hypothetical protein
MFFWRHVQRRSLVPRSLLRNEELGPTDVVTRLITIYGL